LATWPFFGSGTATAGTWTHVAIVRDNGTATLYVNGVASGTLTSAPNSPSGKFGVAVKPTDVTQDQFVGLLDELRFFTFTAGQFNTSDLLINAGPPGATATAATSVSATNATLNGTVNPHGLATTYNFKYGTTAGYGSATPIVTLPPSTTASNSRCVVYINDSVVIQRLFTIRDMDDPVVQA